MNIRSGVGTDNSIIGKLKKDDEVEFTGKKKPVDGIEWAEVKYGNKTGWVIADHLKTERPYEADNSKVTETLKEKIRNKKQSCIMVIIGVINPQLDQTTKNSFYKGMRSSDICNFR